MKLYVKVLMSLFASKANLTRLLMAKSNPSTMVIFRPYITNPKTGERIWAKSRGLRAFPIVVSSDSEEAKKEKKK